MPEIVWLHVVANLLIAAAYFSIPLALWNFARKRPDIPFNKVFILFALFITLCGLTHVFGIMVLWWPAYGIEGLVMLATGIVSCLTAVFVWRIMPMALTLPSLKELLDANNQLNASYEEIEEKVRERTAELERMNNELTLARQKADEGSQAKTEFLTNMSHEIRTPMNAVIGITDLLQRSQPLTEQQREFIATLRMSGTALLALINDLLDIEKIETQTSELEEIPVRLDTIVEETVRVMQLRAAEKQLSFSAQHECKNYTFLGDPNRLRQVLMNLCSNAIKFTEKGGVTVHTICSEPDKLGVVDVTITVADTGIGIAPENQGRVFEKFMQADTSISRRYGGTGLGLSIVKTLVERMSGSVDLESTPNIGTRVIVTLPLRVTAEA
jgi:signal transduction histidine kinase